MSRYTSVKQRSVHSGVHVYYYCRSVLLNQEECVTEVDMCAITQK